MEHFIVEASEQEIKRERDKSRELRRSRWWQNRLALGRLPLVRRPVSRRRR